MDDKMKEYRTKHKKCKWCKYYKYYTCEDLYWCIFSYGECTLKGKVINFPDSSRLCKWYEPEGVKNDN